ncbi:hypothetical protein [Rufibacter psychrotolerans]|uniref:hypothetical protein n=1 Tax=Rufibacter psychrotolerans TaxID=2812556 RepID=UPI0019673C11|nr:hypothetical protein [Rufibacter sp. SYSU D00308]
MEKKDQIMAVLYAKAKGFPVPEDHPTPCGEVAQATHLTVDAVLTLARQLAEEGFVTLCPQQDPPLLYLTVLGVMRGRKLTA